MLGFLEYKISFKSEKQACKKPESLGPGSQRPEHLKQPEHLRVAKRPAAQLQVPNFSRFLFINTQYQLYITISLQSESISQLPECISQRPESIYLRPMSNLQLHITICSSQRLSNMGQRASQSGQRASQSSQRASHSGQKTLLLYFLA